MPENKTPRPDEQDRAGEVEKLKRTVHLWMIFGIVQGIAQLGIICQLLQLVEINSRLAGGIAQTAEILQIIMDLLKLGIH